MRLKDLLIARIRQEGPLSLAEYMRDCLWHPEHGYYATRDPLGAQGDFTTAPEISQMFGELIGLALAQAWLDQGASSPFALAELGPGRGTLMADILKATRQVPGFQDAAQIVLVEASPVLRQAQADTLAGFDRQWIDTVEALPDIPLFLAANEFFDALPLRQFQRDGEGWRERRVGVQDGKLAMGLGPRTAEPILLHRLEDTQDGDVVEHCAAALPILTEIGTRLTRHGGAALIVDYGDWRSLGDTFQALRQHAPADPFESPGTADLTAHVDFEVLAEAARATGCAHSRMTTQGVFLERLGITARAQTLLTAAGEKQAENLIHAHRRLTHPDEMGSLFKVLGLYPSNAAPPPGLEP